MLQIRSLQAWNSSNFTLYVTKDHYSLFLNNARIEFLRSINILGVTLDKDLSYKQHISDQFKKGYAKASALRRIRRFIIWQGKSECSDWFYLGRDFAIRTVSVETVISCVFFVFESRQIQNKQLRVPYNKLLTNLASLSRTGEYWPSVVFVRTS